MKWRWFRWALVVLWCIQIFYFTALPVYNDEHTRGFLTKLLTDILPNHDKAVWIGIIDYLVRKSAHITVFGILALLFKLAIENRPKSYIYSWVFTAFYAATDEYHQSFVHGRTASIFDCLYDAAGALLFLAVLFFISRKISVSKVKALA